MGAQPWEIREGLQEAFVGALREREEIQNSALAQQPTLRLVLEAMLVIGGFLPHDVAAVDAFAFAQLSGRLAIATAVEEVFDHFARFIVSLQGGVLPAVSAEGGIGRVLGTAHDACVSKNGVGWGFW